LDWDEGHHATLRVERIEEPTVFGFTWQNSGLPDDDPRRTYVEFTLEPADSGTRLTVVESGFAQLPDDLHRTGYDAHSDGWASELAELADYLGGFSSTFVVDQTPARAYAAILDVRGWWSEEIDGPTDRVGAEFDYHYDDVHRCRIRVTEAVPGRSVSWLVLENHFDFTADKTEWVGTTMTFDIRERDGKTEVRFTHHGLVSAYECFDVCTNAWGFYINGSLRSLIETGEGQPNRTAQPLVYDARS
jgi:uncharacterized protein YndB with AHSA1/START domain